MSRMGRIVVAVGLVAVAVTAGPAAVNADTDDTTAVHLYGLSGSAVAVGGSFDVENFLALSPILAFGAPRVSLSIDPTPVSSVRASPADPGVIGAADAAGPAIIGMPPGFIPPYPLYADAAYPNGEGSTHVGDAHDAPSTDVPLGRILSGDSNAALDHADGHAVVGLLEAPSSGPPPAVATVGAFGGLRESLSALLHGAGLETRSAAPPSDAP